MPPNRNRTIEAVLLFTAFIASTYGFGLYLFPAMVESVRKDIPFSYGMMGTISGLVQVGYMICSLMSGFLTVRYGALTMVLGSIAICALALGGLAVAPNVITLTVLLAILGGCAAAIWVPMVEIARQIVAKQHQGKVLGLLSSGTSYGVFVNSFLLTGLLTTSGWRSVWVATCVLVTTLALTSFIRLRGLSGRSSTTSATSPATSIRTRLASLPKTLTGAVLGLMFLTGLSSAPYQTYLSAFVGTEAGYDPETGAEAWRVIGIVGMASGFAVGALADRITARWGLIATYLLLSISCFTLIKASGRGDASFVYLAAAAFSISFYAICGLIPTYISHVFGEGAAALVFAFGNVAIGLGGIAGNLLGGVLKVSAGSFEPIYFVTLGSALCGAAISAAMPSERKSIAAMATANGSQVT
ncbi:MFS transporter [Noviherbaspirillum sp.]|uniref:MFS transporter n=1 Tax=Noviherbaspirillum sp. TaxID=1926288 RepID=UPI002B480311|nr:MFS transporter [Noviherbaspirillum sp.]